MHCKQQLFLVSKREPGISPALSLTEMTAVFLSLFSPVSTLPVICPLLPFMTGESDFDNLPTPLSVLSLFSYLSFWSQCRFNIMHLFCHFHVPSVFASISHASLLSLRCNLPSRQDKLHWLQGSSVYLSF